MLMASIKETDLSMEDMDELIGMQSYAVLLNKISVIRDLRFYWVMNWLLIYWLFGCSASTPLILRLIQYP